MTNKQYCYLQSSIWFAASFVISPDAFVVRLIALTIGLIWAICAAIIPEREK